MIATIEFTNAGPFRGTHRIDLGPGAYAITAREESDERRSNAIGKSFLFDAISFVLTGNWPKRRGYDADGWITHGEQSGKITLTLEDGAVASRQKKRGLSQQIRFTRPGASGEASQAAAEAAILKHIEMTAEEVKRGPYVEQKEAMRMVSADPSERAAIVGTWLGLAKAEDAIAIAGERLGLMSKLAFDARTTRDRIAMLLNEYEGDAERQSPTVDADALDREAAEKRERWSNWKLNEDKRRINERRSELSREAKYLREEIAKLEGRGVEETSKTMSDAATTALAVLREAKANRDKKRTVARGEFDGRCPVANITCPARAEINANTTTSQKDLSVANAVVDAADREHERLTREAEEALKPVRMRDAKRAELDRVLREMKALPATSNVTDNQLTEAEAHALLEESHQAAAQAFAARQMARDRDERAKRLQKAKAALETASAEVIAREAAVARAAKVKAVLRAAYRKVSEEAVGTIEEEANRAIAEAGVDLVVHARFEKTGKKLANQCDECGAAYPDSQKVKACERCGAKRGPSLRQQLDFVMSDQSGALDDLAGVAWQLAAASWLLAGRESPWATVMVDEASASMDAALRPSAMRVIASLAGRGHIRQVLIVSHDRASLDMLPNRIEIVKRADGSRAISVV